MLNLSVLLEDSARRFPDRVALVLGDQRMTYADLDAQSNRVANLLVSAGIEPGDTIALSCPNIPQFPVVYYGILKAGAVVVPLNVLLKDREIAYHLDDSDAKAYFCFEGTPELPMGEYGLSGFAQSPRCRALFRITTDPAAPAMIDGVGTLADASRGTTATSTPWSANPGTPPSSCTRAAPPENPRAPNSPTPTWR